MEGDEDLAAAYRAARRTAAVAELADRRVLAVSGPLRQKFLHSLLSNDVEGVAAGDGRRAALMDAKGRLIAFLRVLVGKDTVWLEVPAERLKTVHDLLVHYKVAAPVRFQETDTVVLALLGPEASAVLQRAGAECPPEGPERHVDTSVAGQPVRIARGGDLPAEGLVLHVAAEHAEAVRTALVAQGARAVDRALFDLLRVEDGRPWYGTDVTDANLLHETGLVAEYHSPRKGCYVGQETVARLEARGGNVNKKLRGLQLSRPAAAGAAVSAGGEEVGRLTTVGVSPERGPVALAYVHRSRFEPGTEVEVEGAPATVVALPFAR